MVSDLKVGYGLKDHVSFLGLNFLVNATDCEMSKLHQSHGCRNDVVDYLKYGKGPLTTTGVELVAFLQTEAFKSQPSYPNIQLLVTRNVYNQGKVVKDKKNSWNHVINQFRF